MNTRKLTKAMPLLFALLCLVSTSLLSSTLQISDRAKAYFLIQMSNYIIWPDEETFGEYRLAIVGSKNDHMKRVFNNLADIGALDIKQKPVTVELVGTDQLSKLRSMHLVYVTAQAQDTLREVTRHISQVGTLVVSESQHSKCDFMLNIVTTEKGSMGFELNESNMVAAGLKMRARLKRLGTQVCTVDELPEFAAFGQQTGQEPQNREFEDKKEETKQPAEQPQTDQNSEKPQRETVTRNTELITLQRTNKQQLLLLDKKSVRIHTLSEQVSAKEVLLAELQKSELVLQQALEQKTQNSGAQETTISRLQYTVWVLLLLQAVTLFGLYRQRNKAL